MKLLRIIFNYLWYGGSIEYHFHDSDPFCAAGTRSSATSQQIKFVPKKEEDNE